MAILMSHYRKFCVTISEKIKFQFYKTSLSWFVIPLTKVKMIMVFYTPLNQYSQNCSFTGTQKKMIKLHGPVEKVEETAHSLR